MADRPPLDEMVVRVLARMMARHSDMHEDDAAEAVRRMNQTGTLDTVRDLVDMVERSVEAAPR